MLEGGTFLTIATVIFSRKPFKRSKRHLTMASSFVKPETIGSALLLDVLTARLKEYIVRIFYDNDSRILIALLPLITVWACGSGSRASVASNENAPFPKPRAGKRIERLKGTAEYLTDG
jgi:hypothetical protein